MSIIADDNMSVSPDTLDFAIDDFYFSPSKESAERLARVAQEYNRDEMIGDDETQQILANVDEYLTNHS